MQQDKAGEQKCLRLFGRFSFICILLYTSLNAQSFENFKHSEINSFEEFKDKQDAEFNKYLKEQWKEYKAENSQALYKDKKPDQIMPAQAKKFKSVGPTVSIKIRKKIQKHQMPMLEKKELNKEISFIFFGKKLGFDIDPQYKKSRFYPQSQKGILNFFNAISHSEYENTLNDLQTMSKELHLNDWALYLLIQELSQHIYAYEDERKLFMCYIFNKLGYDVKLGLSVKHIVLMFRSKNIVYATPTYTFDSKKFYILSKYAQRFSQRVYTYKESYPEANKALDFSLSTLPNFPKDIKNKTLSFKQFGKKYTIPYKYNKNLIDFMATYPQVSYKIYFNAPISEFSYEELAKSLKSYIDAKQASIAINFVLNFVQKAFVYEVDQTQFGREKVMFANETLFYKNSDCEDRAILFARLVKSLFKITVIGVKYSDHMATALYIPLKGDSVKANNRKFIIADPTYINANIGQSISKYRTKMPESFITVKGN